MSWLLFYDWNRLLNAPKYWVYSASCIIAMVIAVLLKLAWSETLQPQTALLSQQIALQQEVHHAYLVKLKKASQVPVNYQEQYQQRTFTLPAKWSKVAVFNYISAHLDGSSLLLSQWRWQQDESSQRLFIELKGEFATIRSLLETMMTYSDFVILEAMTLSRESVYSAGVTATLTFAFFSASETEVERE
ncbi:hypothetical protein [Vibrio rarus]|uniref:hypothetical protein n=1 Tax=Vibrio rarus TaxID=413403 RepID=UPI0021C44278|nr:hypothetical protein [Vibrio rarus]